MPSFTFHFPHAGETVKCHNGHFIVFGKAEGDSTNFVAVLKQNGKVAYTSSQQLTTKLGLGKDRPVFWFKSVKPGNYEFDVLAQAGGASVTPTPIMATVNSKSKAAKEESRDPPEIDYPSAGSNQCNSDLSAYGASDSQLAPYNPYLQLNAAPPHLPANAGVFWDNGTNFWCGSWNPIAGTGSYTVYCNNQGGAAAPVAFTLQNC